MDGKTHKHRMIQISPSEDGSLCGIRDYGEDTDDICHAPAVVRVTYALWRPETMEFPKGMPHPSTFFVGACEHHRLLLAQIAERKGGAVEPVSR